MAIINEQIEISNKARHDQGYSDGFKNDSSILRRMYIKETSGYYGDYQYPYNSQVFDGDNVVASENGLEIINNSKTAAVLG